jgi:UDP-N-acetylmuramoyl-tripeptide--D-alanyl-D-alanine ligase
MALLHAALPARLRGEHCATSSEMAEIIAAALRPGDVVTVKGSLGSRMAIIVKRLLAPPLRAGTTTSSIPCAAAE